MRFLAPNPKLIVWSSFIDKEFWLKNTKLFFSKILFTFNKPNENFSLSLNSEFISKCLTFSLELKKLEKLLVILFKLLLMLLVNLFFILSCKIFSSFPKTPNPEKKYLRKLSE